MKYLVTGKHGQLAQEFIRRFEARSTDFIAPDESQLDIADHKIVSELVGSYKPDVIINCAAYNFVDRAEQERNVAFKVNADGPKLLALAAKKHHSFLVHFGSDYVFDGTKENGSYLEQDQVNPLNEYGKSKLRGEQLVREETDSCLIFRLSWVFGQGRQNFVYKLLEWAKEREYLKIACDEFSVPTFTDTVVDITLKALEKGISGLYHLTNSGFCSRYEWAKLILSLTGIRKFVRPVSSDSFQLPARRPKFSAMSNQKISNLLNIDIPRWEDAVKVFLRERNL